MKLIKTDQIENITIPIVDIKSESINKLYDFYQEMIKFIKKKGLGLAACQVGTFKQFFVMKIKDNFKIIINPRFKPLSSGKTKKYNESCLSLPKETYQTSRFIKIWTEFYTINESDLGSPINFVKENLILKQFEACTFQHEYDHCQGITLQGRGIKVL